MSNNPLKRVVDSHTCLHPVRRFLLLLLRLLLLLLGAVAARGIVMGSVSMLIIDNGLFFHHNAMHYPKVVGALTVPVPASQSAVFVLMMQLFGRSR